MYILSYLVCLIIFVVRNLDIHNHFTRKSTDIHIIQCRLKLRVESIKFRDPHLWNSIDLQIRLSKSVYIFKRKYKSYLLGQYPYTTLNCISPYKENYFFSYYDVTFSPCTLFELRVLKISIALHYLFIY